MVSTNVTETKEKSSDIESSDETSGRQNEQRAREAEARRLEELQRELREKEAIKQEQERADSLLREQKTNLEPIGINNGDGSSFIKNDLGQIRETKDASGTVREFGYNDKGELSSFSENGKVWETSDGLTWSSSGEKSRSMRVVVNAEDGAFAYAEGGITRVEFSKRQDFNQRQ